MRASRGLKWENKMYKPKRSIPVHFSDHTQAQIPTPRNQIPTPQEGLTNQIPQFPGTQNRRMPEICRREGGGGMLKYRFNRQITVHVLKTRCFRKLSERQSKIQFNWLP